MCGHSSLNISTTLNTANSAITHLKQQAYRVKVMDSTNLLLTYWVTHSNQKKKQKETELFSVFFPHFCPLRVQFSQDMM